MVRDSWHTTSVESCTCDPHTPKVWATSGVFFQSCAARTRTLACALHLGLSKMTAHKLTNGLHRLLSFGQVGDKHMPAVPHVGPHRQVG